MLEVRPSALWLSMLTACIHVHVGGEERESESSQKRGGWVSFPGTPAQASHDDSHIAAWGPFTDFLFTELYVLNYCNSFKTL